MFDVAIIGGGPAGLATALNLERAGLKVVILEESDRLGGRAKTVGIAGEPVNLGAMFVYTGTASHELATTLGIPLAPFEPTTFGIHVNGQTIVSRDDNDLIANLPISDNSRQQLGNFIAQASAEYRANTVNGKLRPLDPEYGEKSAQARLDGLPDDIQDLLTAAIRGGSVAHPSELSATYALRYFASYLMREKNNRMLAVEGMQSIPEAIAKVLAQTRICMSHQVRQVAPHTDNSWIVHATTADGCAVTMEAKHVVMAVPAPRIAKMVELPDWKREALSKVKTPGSTVLGVVADIFQSDLEKYDDWAFVATAGRAFDVIINPRPGRRDGRAQFVCYGNAAGYIPDACDPSSEVLGQWLEEFLTVAPELRGHILGAEIQSWEHCFSLLTPTRHSVLPELQASVRGSLHFAGDYSSETAGTHGAYAEAARVSREIIAVAESDRKPLEEQRKR